MKQEADKTKAALKLSGNKVVIPLENGEAVTLSSNLTIEDKIIMRDVLKTIINDDDLRKGFRQACVLTTRELIQLHMKLSREVSIELGAISPLPG